MYVCLMIDEFGVDVVGGGVQLNGNLQPRHHDHGEGDTVSRICMYISKGIIISSIVFMLCLYAFMYTYSHHQ